MLSVIIVCNKIDESLSRTVKSVEALRPQMLIDISSDKKANLGLRKNRLVRSASFPWVLVLDTDEVVSANLLFEINKVINSIKSEIHGYEVPYKNFAFNKYIQYGGEKFAKARLFRRDYGRLTETPIHEEIVINGKKEKLRGVIYHSSYRSVGQIISKFTKYAWLVAGEKREMNEPLSIKKLFLYGPHMVWARAIKDEGWRDGWQGIVLALCFGYMEMLIYWFLLWQNLFR